MLVLPLSVLAQNSLSGKVTDASSNQAMSGVSVVITGTSNGTFTNSDGTFTLKNVKLISNNKNRNLYKIPMEKLI